MDPYVPAWSLWQDDSESAYEVERIVDSRAVKAEGDSTKEYLVGHDRPPLKPAVTWPL